MPLTATRRYSAEESIDRAEALKKTWPAAIEILDAYKQILQCQASVRDFIDQKRWSVSRDSQGLPGSIDFSALLPQFGLFLGRLSRLTAPNLAEGSSKLQVAGTSYWNPLLQSKWSFANPEETSAEAFFADAFLQPVAEHLAQSASIAPSNSAQATCPFCNRKPVCGVLRPEGDGAKRSLICSFCATEWEYRRLICSSCGQEDIERLPVYTAEDAATIRIEACDACKHFIKTIDLTKDGRGIPVVDEIASLPLTLWAEEKGYKKLQRNLFFM